MKKAMVERMKSRYHREWFPEDGAPYPVRVFFMKDEAAIGWIPPECLCTSEVTAS